MASGYTVEQRGSLNSDNFRLFFKDSRGAYISPIHDIPLWVNEDQSLVNMVVEVTRWTNSKLEMNTSLPLNPISQDINKKTGGLRYVSNCFPHHGYIWNYGALPQTWEDPQHIDLSTKFRGDGDPVDVVEIGRKLHAAGSVITIKVLGVLAMIDEEETDWKVIGIDVTDPLASKMSDISDVENHLPGLIKATVTWFRVYKIADGKLPNKFAFSARPRNKFYTMNVIRETHDHWKRMVMKDEQDSMATTCTVLEAPGKISQSQASQIVLENPDKGPDLEIENPAVFEWFYAK